MIQWRLALFFLALLAAGMSAESAPTSIGIEYVLIEDANVNSMMASTFAQLGIPAVKHYAEHVEWGQMQSGPIAPINFTRMDNYVREYQKSGFMDLVFCLKPHSRWASKKYWIFGSPDPTPKPEFLSLYEKWISEVVERYDADGVNDMPGLLRPVNYLEIGSEFSSYEPEPVGEYLTMLEHAYRAAHKASTTVLVAHAALLTTTAFKDSPGPGEYEAAFAAMPKRIAAHSLGDIRAILDRPDIFDIINIHNIGDPYEIEDMMRWLRFEMNNRNYSKPVLISDTSATPFAAWGPATVCNASPDAMAILVPPARETDRCRMAAYFTKLVNKDSATLAWTRSFVASDTVQKTIIAAEQRIRLIDLSFTIDLPFLTEKFLQAGAGVAAWSGMIQYSGTSVVEKRPNFYAVKQMAEHLKGYHSIRRLVLNDPRARVYEIEKPSGTEWIAWMNPGKLILPEDKPTAMQIEIPMPPSHVTIEPVITLQGQSVPYRFYTAARNGKLTLHITANPVYVSKDTNLQ